VRSRARETEDDKDDDQPRDQDGYGHERHSLFPFNGSSAVAAFLRFRRGLRFQACPAGSLARVNDGGETSMDPVGVG
jgi:hypothetical protein